METESRRVVARDWEEGKMDSCSMGIEFQKLRRCVTQQ